VIEVESEPKLNKYEEYLKYPKKEFDKRRRRERRTNLAELQEKPAVQIEMTKEISDKISDYKSRMKSDFDRRYFIQKDEECNKYFITYVTTSYKQIYHDTKNNKINIVPDVLVSNYYKTKKEAEEKVEELKKLI